MPKTIRFAAPIYPNGRHCLLCGSVTVGAIFPPVGYPRSKTPWGWRLFEFGANPARVGHAKDETEAKGHLVAAFALTLAEAGLEPIAREENNHSPQQPRPSAPTTPPPPKPKG